MMIDVSTGIDTLRACKVNLSREANASALTRGPRALSACISLNFTIQVKWSKTIACAPARTRKKKSSSLIGGDSNPGCLLSAGESNRWAKRRQKSVVHAENQSI